MESLELKEDHFHVLCSKKVTQELSPEEEKELENWLAASRQNHAMLEGMNQIWHRSKPPAFTQIPDIDLEWDGLSRKLGLCATKSEKSSVRSTKHPSPVFTLAFKPALAVSLAALILAVSLLLWKQGSVVAPYQEILTENGQKTEVLLSDGSKVVLNCGSVLKFKKQFSRSSRDVELNGEAFFEVATDERPFCVTTENAKTSVLGTEFNVRCRHGKTSVTVLTGRVKLESLRQQGKEVLLNAAQKSEIHGNSAPSEPVQMPDPGQRGWMTGVLRFEQSPIAEISEELERTYNIRIQLDKNRDTNETLTATFDNLPLETVLKSMCMALGTTYTLKDDLAIIH